MVIDTVTVGNPGNADDIHDDGYGGVDYVYKIGKFEVTAGQYTEFLNAVADDDAYGLYNTSMWTHPRGCKIERTGSSPNYSYSVATAWANRPVSNVSGGDAARFANWLHNGQPTGAQDANSTEDGSYDVSATHTYFGPGGVIIDPDGLDHDLLDVVREEDGTWVIPSQGEWYKAAYHKNDGVTGNYFDYPMSSDSVPSNDLVEPTDPGNNAIFRMGSFPPYSYTIGSPYWRTEVGAFENSASPYGTFDQGGNVREWNEAVLLGLARSFHGGSFEESGSALWAASLNGTSPTTESGVIGFRVADVSEPGRDIPTVPEWGLVTMALLVLTAGTLMWARRGAAVA